MPASNHTPHPGGRPYLGGQSRKPPPNSIVITANAERLSSMKQKTPLEILLEIAGDESLNKTLEGQKLRAYCASQAAPYIHQRQPQAIVHPGANGKPLAPPSFNISFSDDGGPSITKTEVMAPGEAADAGVPPKDHGQPTEAGEEVEDAEIIRETGT